MIGQRRWRLLHYASFVAFSAGLWHALNTGSDLVGVRGLIFALVVLAIAGPVLAIFITIVAGLASVEVFRLLRHAGYGTFAALGTALTVVIVLDAAFPDTLEGSGTLLVAIGVVLIGVAAFTKVEPRDGLNAWTATVFGAIYASMLGFILRLGHAAPSVDGAPLAALGSERGWIILLIFAVWSYDTGAYLVGKQFGREKFLTHISPSKTYAGLFGGLIATTVSFSPSPIGAKGTGGGSSGSKSNWIVASSERSQPDTSMSQVRFHLRYFSISTSSSFKQNASTAASSR